MDPFCSGLPRLVLVLAMIQDSGLGAFQRMSFSACMMYGSQALQCHSHKATSWIVTRYTAAQAKSKAVVILVDSSREELSRAKLAARTVVATLGTWNGFFELLLVLTCNLHQL